MKLNDVMIAISVVMMLVVLEIENLVLMMAPVALVQLLFFGIMTMLLASWNSSDNSA